MKKPSPEAKALSLFLMAYKKEDPVCKDKSRRINKQWELVKSGGLSHEDYVKEVEDMLTSLGGYSEVLEKTVQFYIEKTGEWKLEGDDKYCMDAKEVANKILKQK
ncbi:MAG: hypothetical protein COA33_008030 [Fluviicola sp.]|nr:hypothetical protein [Fluviicola sp.]